MKQWRCWFRHDWKTCTECVDGKGTGQHPGTTFVIAWKQCPRCGSSKLLYILR